MAGSVHAPHLGASFGVVCPELVVDPPVTSDPMLYQQDMVSPGSGIPVGEGVADHVFFALHFASPR
ncbi:hypothetical protein LOC73_41365 [Mycolicibacterium mageritense]|nr:hypothetical protein [Mycolicibacterium mageritense]